MEKNENQLDVLSYECLKQIFQSYKYLCTMQFLDLILTNQNLKTYYCVGVFVTMKLKFQIQKYFCMM